MVDGWLFYDEPRAIAGVEQGEGLDWFPERDDPGDVTCVPVGSMSRWAAAGQLLSSLCSYLFLDEGVCIQAGAVICRHGSGHC